MKSHTYLVPYMAAFGGALSDATSGHLNTVEVFDSSWSWKLLPNMTAERGYNPAACVVNDTVLIVCGGFGVTFLASCERFDFTNRSAGWRLIASMITARRFTSGILLPDRNTFIVTGGFSGPTTLSACEKLDIRSNTWTSIRAMASSRRRHSSVFYANRVVVLGAFDGINVYSTCEQYNVITNTWSLFPPFNTARRSFGAAVVIDKIYIAGGETVGDVPISSVEVYNGTAWSLLGSSLSRARYACAAVSFKNNLVVLGGSNISLIEVYDPISLAWSTLPNMTTRRFYPAAVAFLNISY